LDFDEIAAATTEFCAMDLPVADTALPTAGVSG
jgi:hypothetical protein